MVADNPFNIHIQTTEMGKDYVFIITGGTAHIGAVATAYLNNNQINVDLLELPGHKEGELAKECAELAVKVLGHTSSVLIGIHVDNASKEDIEYIVSFVRSAMNKELIRIKTSP
ncbi:hypothetical protein BHF71_06980 [Vulcanibacillus modesticaldus]|uniref:Prenylated flavin chaperone LpdD-like domain-containing protein n=1 Tax=Vulcanibacillus modesticaldus TaxID=337097 RepID=A0A1D2YWD5_9BACI|nr:hypothetical protein [Vulcanibacillus modesticaldus]OEG00009.1 hypothetical protein BHF71_06980 [Vulcanibacillus modesticaldus]